MDRACRRTNFLDNFLYRTENWRKYSRRWVRPARQRRSSLRVDEDAAVSFLRLSHRRTRKMDLANICICHLHSIALNNPDVIDLHWYQMIKAVECLGVFIDEHVCQLRSCGTERTVGVIAGRDWHSPSGISKIKIAVERRLTDRRIR